MRITWYGHAAFLIEAEGTRIILDPYRSPESGGYEPINEPADIVVVSHENDRYHSHLGQIVPPFEVIRALELPEAGREFRGVRFKAIHVYENDQRLPEDEVTVISLVADGLRVVFLGDLGHALQEEELAQLRGAEILLAAAGGPPTIDFPLIRPLVDAIGPKWLVPMHYKTPKINLDIQPVERFFECFPEAPIDRPGASWFEASRSNVPSAMRIVALEHAR